MSIEERLRESLRHQVDAPPAVSGLADRSLRGASRARRMQGAAGVVAVTLIAVVVPLQLAQSRDRSPHGVAATPSATVSTRATADPGSTSTSILLTPTPSRSAIRPSDQPKAFTALPFAEVDARPRVEYLIGDKLITGTDGPLPELPHFDRTKLELLTTSAGTIMRNRGAKPGEFSVYLVRRSGEVKGLVKGEVRGIAADATRLAYAVAIGPAGASTKLVLLDLKTGDEIQRIEEATQLRPVSFSGNKILMESSATSSFSAGLWDLASNEWSALRATPGDLPRDSVGDVALFGEGVSPCAVVWDVAALNQRFSTCVAGRASDEIDYMYTLAPDGKRYAGTRFRTDAIDHRWPVIADATTGRVDDRLRAVFDDAELHIANEETTQLVWEDATHLIVVGYTPDERKLLIRCEVVEATCEIAHDTGVPAAPVVTLARPVY